MDTQLSPGRRRLVLVICCSALFLATLDVTIVNLALPSIRRDLGASSSALQWVVDAYTLTIACLLLLSGSTADRIGRRRVFRTGLVVFGIGSLLCSVAPTTGWLIAFRAMQAVGGSMLNPVAMSIITNTFTDRRERATAIGAWGAVVGVSMAVGPVLGGFLVDTVGWRAIFWVNVPVAAAAVVLATLFIPESRAPRARRIDPVGQALVVVLLGGLTFGIIEGPVHGWGSPEILGCFVAAALALVLLVAVESRVPDPLIDPRFFRSAPFAGATVCAVSAFAAFAGVLFLGALYLQDVRGLTPLQAGLLTVPMAAMSVVLPPLAGRMVGRNGPRLPMALGGTGITLGSLLLLATVATGAPLVLVALALVVFGAGFGMLNAPITNTAVSGMPVAQAGVAAAVASTSRQVGTAMGIAVLGSVVTARIEGPVATGFVPASLAAWVVMASCGVVVLVLGLATTGAWGRRSAERTAAALAPAAPVPA